MSLWRVIALLAGLAAVVVPAGSASAAVFAGSPSQCSDRLDTLAKQAAEPAPPIFLPVSPNFQPARLTGPRWTEAVIAIVEVGDTDLWIDGQPVNSAGDDRVGAVSGHLSSVMDRWRLLHPEQKQTLPVGIWLDGRVSARSAVQLLERLSKRHDLVIFGMSEPTAAVPQDVAARLATIRAETAAGPKARLISDALRDALAGCHRSDGKVTETATLAAALDSARACSCVGADIDLLEGIAAPPDLPNVHGKKIRLSPRTKRTVTLSSSAGIGELLGSLPSSGTVSIRWRPTR